MKAVKDELSPLYNILNNKKYKKQIKTHVYYSMGSQTYLLMIHLLNDGTAIELAQQYNFPRGFPIIWTKSDGFTLFGFHPKFTNDRKQTANLEEFQTEHGIQIMLKYSGFLGQVLVWKAGSSSEICWTCASKNATSNEFSNDAIRITKSFMTPALVKCLYQGKYYICGEVMSKNDMTHGAQVLNEQFVCTCAGRVSHSLDQSCFTNILDHKEMHKVCVEYGIPVPEIWYGSNAMEVGTALAKTRDFMDMSKLRDVLGECKLECYPGTVRHEDILGDIIEGLVIWVDKVIKYKFPIYTTRTFGLRSFISTNTNPAMFLSPAFKSHMDQYLGFWVTTSEGHEYWKDWLAAAALCASKHDASYFSPIHSIGSHIRLADEIRTMTGEVIQSCAQEFNKAVGIPEVQGKARIIIIVGPIGSGKSTYGRYLERKIPGSIHIDGDELYHISSPESSPINLTMKLGSERMISTLSQISRVLVHGKTPIISCGGGVLFQGGKPQNLALRTYFRNTLGLDLDIVLYLPCGPSHSDITSFYNSWKVHDVIKYRVERGLWSTTKKLDKFIADIQDLSSKNNQYAKSLTHHANHIIAWKPIVYPCTVVDPTTPLPPGLRVSVPALQTLHYGQFRILTAVQMGQTVDDFKCGHITLDFTGALKHVYIDDMEELRSYLKLAGTIPGQIVKYRGCSFVTLVPDPSATKLIELIKQAGTTFRSDVDVLHITVTAGKHAPATMAQACTQYHQDPDDVNIPTKTGEVVHYEKPKVSPTSIHLLDLVYMA